MRGNQSHIRFEKVVLTKDLAVKSGHIAWVQEDNPIVAIRNMYQSVMVQPFNIAV